MKLLLIPFLIIAFHSLSQVTDTPEYDKLYKDYTGDCVTYFSNGSINMIRSLDSGKVVKLSVYKYEDGSLFKYFDLTNLANFTMIEELNYAKGIPWRKTSINNGSGYIKEYYPNGKLMSSTLISDKRIEESWIFLQENNLITDSIHIIHCSSIGGTGYDLEYIVPKLRGQMKSRVERLEKQHKQPESLNSNEESEYWFTSSIARPIQVGLADSASMKIFEFPSETALMNGGFSQLTSWIKENLVYPELSMVMGEEETVQVWFVVELDGSISNVYAEKYMSKRNALEAKRLVSAMPKWKPARNDNQNVRSLVRLYIEFKIDE